MAFVYRGLKAKLDRHIVTTEEIDRQMERLRQQNPRIALVDNRPTEQGDEVILDYAGVCDGVQFPGGTAQNQSLVLGSGMFIPGFEEQLLDKVPGEEVVVKVTFPKSYHAENLAGKAAEFHCKIQEIRVKTQYELDDVFAQEVGGCYTFDEMREALQKSLQDFTDRRGEQDVKERLLQKAAATVDYTPTFEEIEAAIDAQMENLEAQLAQQGLNTDMYCSFMNTTKEALREDARHDAEAEVRKDAAIREIVKLENLDVTQEEIGEAVALICRQNKITVEELKPHYDAQFEQAVIKSVLTGKVMSLIYEAADITVV